MMSELDRRMTNRTIATPIATLPHLRRVTPWLWVICERCQHRAPTALAPWLIRWGPDASGEMLRRSARCGQCGGKGAIIQLPGWGGLDAPVRAGQQLNGARSALPSITTWWSWFADPLPS